MRLRVLFLQDGDDGAMPSVREVCDEITEDAWGRLPDFYIEALEAARNTGCEYREAFVYLPDNPVRSLFETGSFQVSRVEAVES
jgi:hypothetical protein